MPELPQRARIPAATWRVLLRAEPGVIGKLMECHTDWCRVEIEGQRGWLLRGEFWGTLPGETLP
ncbi:MAG: SH3 domain-containing protein [Geminicoccaceae bacterium]